LTELDLLLVKSSSCPKQAFGHEAAGDLPCHTGLVLTSANGSALGSRPVPDKSVQLVRGDREASACRGRSAEQRVALDLLLDPEIGIVFARPAGPAPASSAMALVRRVEAVMERRQAPQGHRVPAALRGRRPGTRYLPGPRRKMAMAQAVYETLSAVTTGRQSTRCGQGHVRRCCR